MSLDVEYKYLEGLDLTKVISHDEVRLLSGLLDDLHNEEVS